MKKILIAISAGLITAIAQPAFAETNEEKAAFALNADESEVTVSDVKRSGMKVKFKAHYDGGTYNCYYTSMTSMGVKSDALCSGPINKKDGVRPHSGAGCNDLLRAAGRC